MMKGLFMTQRLGEEVLEIYGSPAALSFDFFNGVEARRQPTSGRRSIRCGIYDAGTSSFKHNCHDLLMTAGNSENMRSLELSKRPTKRTRKDCSRANKILSGSSSEIMDENLWKEFPEDLFEAVIARLPVDAFFRFRSVCQKWNMLLNSPSFSQECAQKKQTQTWFYTVSHSNGSMGSIYDPSSKKWYHPTPRLLPKKRVLPVASAGGLICFLEMGERNLYICNPLTRSYKKLFPMSIGVVSRVSAGMALSNLSTQSGYKILLVFHSGEYGIYDSMNNSWIRPGNLPSACLPLTLNRRSQAVCIDKTLYFLRHNPDGILSYDVENGIWKQFAIPAPHHLTDQIFAVWGSRIMLLGLLTKNAATCICVFELQKMTLLWKEVDRMPNLWCLEVYGKHVRMTSLGNKGVFLLSLRSRQMNWLITYDARTREWVKVPSFMQPEAKRRQLLYATTFEPCLSALP